MIKQGNLQIYTCDEVKLLSDHWKTEFRIKNGTDHILNRGINDTCYESYCKSIDEFINQCECHLKCDKCLPEDHEGYFCRCESRNIELAKQLRHKK